MQGRPYGRVLMSLVLGVLGSSASALAQSGGSAAPDSKVWHCSNETLSGRYGSSSEGVLLPAPGVALEFRGLTVTRFDGLGHLTWREHTVVNGEPLQAGWTMATGTYAVNADCTGTMVVTTPNSPAPLNLFIVVVKRGREVRTVLDAHAILSVFTKVD
jgi:hypothetical protein